jgi:hypothetical protein
MHLVGFHYKNDVLGIGGNSNVTAYLEVPPIIFMDKIIEKKFLNQNLEVGPSEYDA